MHLSAEFLAESLLLEPLKAKAERGGRGGRGSTRPSGAGQRLRLEQRATADAACGSSDRAAQDAARPARIR